MDELQFLLTFIKKPKTIGAVCPSSQDLALEICSEIPQKQQAQKRFILEIGPGTGIFTKHLVDKLNPIDELHLVEIDEPLCMRLQHRYSHVPNVKFFNRSIIDHAKEGLQYDFVVSGLPLNAFSASFVEQIFSTFSKLTRPNSKLSYFEYLWLPHLSLLFSKPKERDNVRKILEIKRSFYEQHSLRTVIIYPNFPPARVLHHSMR